MDVSKVSKLEEENSSLRNEISKLRALLQAQRISKNATTARAAAEYSSDDGGHAEVMPNRSRPSRECANGDDSEDGASHFYYSAGETELRPMDGRTSSEDDLHHADDDASRVDRPYHSEDDQHHLHTQSDEEPPKGVLVSGLRLVPLFNAQDQCMEIVAQVVDDISVPNEMDSPTLSVDPLSLTASQDSSKKKRVRKGPKQRQKLKAQKGLSAPIKRNQSNPNLCGYTVADREIVDRLKTNRAARKQHKKKKNKAKKHPRRRRPRRNPLVRAALEAADLLASVVPEGLFEDQEAERAKDLKVKVVEELRKNDCPIDVIAQVSTVEELLEKELTQGKFSAFYLVNLGACVEKYLQWVKLLPRVRPMYAVKSNPDINIVRTLKFLGAGFDCASMAELEEVLSVGAQPTDIIYANPCKGKDHILYAREKGIHRMTFDNMAELEKVHALHPEAQLVLRILPDDSHSMMPFGSKFGASFIESVNLIKRCRQLGAQLIGVSFHVGSGCYSSIAWHDAIRLARQVFDEAEKEGLKLSLLDIGGGYPGADDGELSFEEAIDGIGPLLDELFPPEVTVIAEPGRYFCTSCYTLAVTIISRRDRFVANRPVNNIHTVHHEPERVEAAPVEGEEPQREVLYYLSDGLYGSFNNIVFDHAKPLPLAMKTSDTKKRSTLFGPTCDSIDVVCKDIDLPEMEIGDWLYFMNMGAYTVASASSFNGFRPPNAKYLMYISGPKLVNAPLPISPSSVIPSAVGSGTVGPVASGSVKEDTSATVAIQAASPKLTPTHDTAGK